MAGESLGLSAAWIPPCAIMVLASPRRSLVDQEHLGAPLVRQHGGRGARPAAADDQDVHVVVRAAEIQGIGVDPAAPFQQIRQLVRNPIAGVRADGQLPHGSRLIVGMVPFQEGGLLVGGEARKTADPGARSGSPRHA